MNKKPTKYSGYMRSGLQAAALALLAPGVCVADEATTDGAWEMSDLKLKLRAKNTTSAYSAPVTKEMETLLLHTVDPDRPGVAFRCEKGKMYVVLAVRASPRRYGRAFAARVTGS